MSDRFDLEQKIMECWSITSDLKALTEAMLENNLSTDKTANILIGLEQLYDIKFDQMFRTFEKCLKQGEL